MKSLLVSFVSKRIFVFVLNMRFWYVSSLVLFDGIVLKGVILVVIRFSELNKDVFDANWVFSVFEEFYEIVVKMFVKRRIYCLEMNFF